MVGFGKPLIIAVGVRTEHWQKICDEFPLHISTCCIDVRRALSKEWDEDTEGIGFQRHVRDRMKAKPTWCILWEIALHILNKFGIVTILCNHGKHRSLSLAVEMQMHLQCDLVSIRSPARPFHSREAEEFMEDIRLPVREFVHEFGEQPFPISGVWLCQCGFNGQLWSEENDPGSQSCISKYVTMTAGDVVVSVVKGQVQAQGWSYGIVFSHLTNQKDEGWFPPAFVVQLPRGFFCEGCDFFRDLRIHI